MKNTNAKTEILRRLAPAAVFVGLMFCITGCTSQSNKMAQADSERSDTIRTAVVERQNGALKILLYRQTLDRLDKATTHEDRVAILNDAWNERDLIEFWATQDLLARGLHLVSVDAYIWSQQGMFSLLAKKFAKDFQGPLHSLDEWLGKKAGEAIAPKEDTPPGTTTKPADTDSAEST